MVISLGVACVGGANTLNAYGTMQKVNFDEAVEEILEGDSRYEKEAYAFVRDALDFTLKRRKREGKPAELVERHVGGEELLDGFREFALQEFGPMVPTVLEEWKIGCCEDVGHIVFNLIESGIFGKADEDTIDDFKGHYEFRKAFVTPFLPSDVVDTEAKGVDGQAKAPVRSGDS